MKIIIVASNLNAIGGIQRYHSTLRDSLRELGHSVQTVEVGNTRLFSKIFFVCRFIAKIAFFHPHFIVCSNINYAILGYWTNKLFGVQYSVHTYGIETIKIKSRFIPYLRAATCLVVPFEITGRNIATQLPETVSKILIVPNSLDEKEYFIKEKSQILTERHHLQNSKIILTICRLSPAERDNKGYAKVIRALPEALRSVPDAKYLLVGGGDDLDNMKSLVKELHLENKVILTGPAKQEEMVDYYNLADVFILPSLREGFPALVLLESLACGRPVIGGNQEGAERALLNGELGLIVDAENISSIAAALIRVLSGQAPTHFKNPQFLRESMLRIYGRENYLQKVREMLVFIAASEND